MKTQQYFAKDANETESFGESFAKGLKGNETIALFGDLGAGKTTFVRGLARGIGIDSAEISSPTFAIVHEHEGKYTLYHYDMYRIESWEDLDTTGFFESVGRGIVVVEWSENIKNALPDDRIEINISAKDDGRLFDISYPEGGGTE